MMSEKDTAEAIRSLRNRTERLDHEGDCWSTKEKNQLAAMFAADRGITEIVICLQRTEQAVIQQAVKMGLYGSPRRQHRKNPAAAPA